jgi:hypothetical protein
MPTIRTNHRQTEASFNWTIWWTTPRRPTPRPHSHTWSTCTRTRLRLRVAAAKRVPETIPSHLCRLTQRQQRRRQRRKEHLRNRLSTRSRRAPTRLCCVSAVSNDRQSWKDFSRRLSRPSSFTLVSPSRRRSLRFLSAVRLPSRLASSCLRYRSPLSLAFPLRRPPFQRLPPLPLPPLVVVMTVRCRRASSDVARVTWTS